MAYKVAFEEFGSIHSMLLAGDKRPLNKAFENESSLSSETGDKSFTGTASYKEAKELLRNGWDEPLDKIKVALGGRSVNSNTQADKRRPHTGVVGYQPCVPNALLGLPNSMICSEMVKQKVKAVTVIYSPTVNCGWSTSEIIECGITALKIVKLLEQQGMRVKLTIEGMSAYNGNDLSVVHFEVKGWREQLDLKKLAFPVAHPSLLRRIAFKWLETCPKITNRGYTSGYGTPISNGSYESVVKTLKEGGVLKENVYYINASLCKNMEQDIDRILEAAGMTGLKAK